MRELYSVVDVGADFVTWRQGRCVPYGEGRAFWALREIVQAHAGILETHDPAQAEELLERVVEPGPDHRWICERLRPLVGLDAREAEPEENYAAWLRFFRQVAARLPLVAVIEDLHWADEALLAFIDYVALHLDDGPLLLVGTARPELFERHPAFAASGGRVTRIWLDRLSDDETRNLVWSLPEMEGGDAAAVALVASRAEGNPFFAEELARLLADGAGDPAALAALPQSVQAVIAARIDALSPGAKAALADGAVIGAAFWRGALEALGGAGAADAGESLHELADRQLVRPVRQSLVEGEEEYAFCHGMVREVAYAEVPRGVRARKHAAFARWLEGKVGERARGDLCDVLAWHYGAAAELARAAGDAELEGPAADAAVAYLNGRGRPRHGPRRPGGGAALRARSGRGGAAIIRPARRCSPAPPRRSSRRAATGSPRRRCWTPPSGSRRPATAAPPRSPPPAAPTCCTHSATRASPCSWRGRWPCWRASRPAPRPSPCSASSAGRSGWPATRGAVWTGSRSRWTWRGASNCPSRPSSSATAAASAASWGTSAGWPTTSAPSLLAGERGRADEASLLTFNYADALLSYRGPAAAAAALAEGLDAARRRRLEAIETAAGGRRQVRRAARGVGRRDGQAAHGEPGRGAGDVRRVGQGAGLGRGAGAGAGAQRGGLGPRHRPRAGGAAARAAESRGSRAVPRLARAARAGERDPVDLGVRAALLRHRPATSSGSCRRGRPARRLGAPSAAGQRPELRRLPALRGPHRAPAGDDALAARLSAGVESDAARSSATSAPRCGPCSAERRGEYEAAATLYVDAAARWHAFVMPYEEAHALLGRGRCLVRLARGEAREQRVRRAHDPGPARRRAGGPWHRQGTGELSAPPPDSATLSPAAAGRTRGPPGRTAGRNTSSSHVLGETAGLARARRPGL